jgi:hypothetical protein
MSDMRYGRLLRLPPDLQSTAGIAHVASLTKLKHLQLVTYGANMGDADFG